MSTSDAPEEGQASAGRGAIAEVLGDRYHVVSKLGAGAFGEVYEAKDTTLGRSVAIKRIRLDAFAEGAQLEEVKKRFTREAQVAAQLRHPNIVTTHDIVEAADSSFIVMEMVEGKTLSELMRDKGRLGLEETVAILTQAAAALDHAHANKVVHRDVKPANLMVEPSGHVKVMDFGIAKAETSGHITATGTILGTPNYMSPEQAMGKEVDGRSDLFSLACIAYECLTGARPFQGDQVTAILLKIVNEEPPVIEHEKLGLPRGAGPVLQRALAKDPDHRYPTGAALIEALATSATAGGEDAPTVVTTPAPQAPAPVPPTMGVAPPTERSPEPTSPTIRASDLPRSRRLLPMAALALLVTALGLWVVSGSSSDAPAPDVAASAAPAPEAGAAAPSSLVVTEEAGFLGRLMGAAPTLHITVPAGTPAAATLATTLSSETAQAGDPFSAPLAAPIVIEGHEAIGAGSRLEGHVAHASAAGKVSGTGEITLEFDRIVTADGESFPIVAEPFHREARSTKKEDATKVGGAAGVGAIVGGLFGGKKGAAIGGAIGGAAGGAAVVATKGEEVVLAEGTELTVQLESPITVSIRATPPSE